MNIQELFQRILRIIKIISYKRKALKIIYEKDSGKIYRALDSFREVDDISLSYIVTKSNTRTWLVYVYLKNNERIYSAGMSEIGSLKAVGVKLLKTLAEYYGIGEEIKEYIDKELRKLLETYRG